MFFRFFIKILLGCDGDRIEHLNGSLQLVIYKVIIRFNLVSHQPFQMLALKIRANNFPWCFIIFKMTVVIIVIFCGDNNRCCCRFRRCCCCYNTMIKSNLFFFFSIFFFFFFFFIIFISFAISTIIFIYSKPTIIFARRRR